MAKALEQQPAPPRVDPSPPNVQAKAVAEAATAGKLDPPPASRGSSSDNGSGSSDLSAEASLAGLNAPATSESSAKSGGGGGAAFGSTLGRFKLSRCLSRWSRRGLAVSGLSKKQAACMVRTDPLEDETNGFFVAVFERENGVASGEGGVGKGGGVGGGGGGGRSEVEGKKRRNRHKNRKKNKKKRKREEAGGDEDGGEDKAVQESEQTQDSASMSKAASDGYREVGVGGAEVQ